MCAQTITREQFDSALNLLAENGAIKQLTYLAKLVEKLETTELEEPVNNAIAPIFENVGYLAGASTLFNAARQKREKRAAQATEATLNRCERMAERYMRAFAKSMKPKKSLPKPRERQPTPERGRAVAFT